MSGVREISARVRAAEARAGQAPGSVTLIAVSKTQPPERVAAALDDGQRIFGENRVQETEGRWPPLQERFAGIELHLIGPLQSNKARAAMALFDVIHTLDRPRLIGTIARLAQERGACPRLFIQVNTGAEAQKAGCLPDEVDALVREARAADLPLIGLMCIPPADLDPVPHFSLLADLAVRNGLAGLSMGMSADFEAAIAHGATHVRVGSAIFGGRSYPAVPG